MDLNTLIERCLFNLKEGGLTANILRYYNTAGFGTIRKYHEKFGQTNLSHDVCDKLIQELRICCENGEMPKCKWRTIRRCAAVLRAFEETGTTELPNLGKWEWLNAPYRVKPTPEQFADSDNIFAIVWNVERELESIGMAFGSVMAYTYGGFDKILRHFIALGITSYDESALNDFIIDAHIKITDRSKFQLIRKSAALIHEYYQVGKIEPKILEQWDKQKPAAYFTSVIERFKFENDRRKKWALRSKSSAYHAIAQFLMTLESMGHNDFQNITLKVVSDCVSIMAKRYTSGLKPTLSYIRAFLRFVYEHGISLIDLVKAVPGSVSPKRAVYSGFTTEEIDKLLAAVDRTTAQGKRDYAMLLIGIRTGLRAVDVAKLKRRDIDWRNYAVNIVQSKTNRPLVIPLSAEVGNAIADYILNGRPTCDSPNVFIRSIHPRRQLTPAACGCIVRKYFHKAGLPKITNRPVGFHTLRRSFGAHLLKSGVPVDMIQELLGPSDLNSVQPYLASNEPELRECAIGLIPLPEADGGVGYDIPL